MVYKPSREELIEARKCRLSRKDRGSDIEYIKCLYEEFKNMRGEHI